MNLLLINPNREQMPHPSVPVGLCMVATAVDRAGHDVEVLDLVFSKAPHAETMAKVRERCPDVVGLTIRNIDNCNFEAPVFFLTEIRDEVIRAIREARPEAKIVLGGSGLNVSPWEVLTFLEADYALVGEGEEAMPLLLKAMETRTPLEQVPGFLSLTGPAPRVFEVRVPGGDVIIQREPASGRAVVSDFSNSVSEAWRWVKLKRYEALGGPYSVQTKRGCALRCVYCTYNNLEGRSYRLRTPEHIADEIEEAASAHGVRLVDFVDSTFNLPVRFSMTLCEELARRELPVTYSTMGVNPAGSNLDLLRAMRRAGFGSVMCTPESAADATLKGLQKGYGRKQVIRAAENLRKAGLKTFWFFMFGAPGETMNTLDETLSFCKDHIPPTDMVLFTTGLRVYAGTPLEKYCKEIGWFEPDDTLLRPSWYISPEIELHQLYATVVKACKANPNWMTNGETILKPGLASFMKRGFRIMGWDGPFWSHLPKWFRLASRVGARQKQLSQNYDRVTSVGSHDPS
jgi:radical SAM superfamily enzyme YgiQ (UPF0313 family)